MILVAFPAGGRARNFDGVQEEPGSQDLVGVNLLLELGFGQQLDRYFQGTHGILAADVDLHGLLERRGPDRANLLPAGPVIFAPRSPCHPARRNHSVAQVDGTKVEKVFERGGKFNEFKSGFNCCKWLLSCLRCRCFECPGCPKCPSLCGCLPKCPSLCDCLKSCCKSSTSMSDEDSKYDMEARTVKALQEILFTESKL